MQQSDELIDEGEVNIGSQEQFGLVIFEINCANAILKEIHKSPSGAISPPSYTQILKKKLVDTSGSSKEYYIEQITKKAGRKSRKDIREEEAERLKMQGS